MTPQEQRRQRDEKIMLALDKLTYATRQQLQVIQKLGGDRNAHRLLHRLEKDKLVSSIRTEKKIYFLSSKGQQYVGSNKELKRSWITHTLMRNDLYIKLGMPDSWRIEVPVKLGDTQIIADAAFKVKGEFHFVEIDNEQTMRNNQDKIKKYRIIFKAMYQQFQYHPTLIWYTFSDLRKEKLAEECNRAGIKYKVY